MRKTALALTAFAAVAIILTLPVRGTTQTTGEKLHIEAFAVNMSNIATGSNQVVMMDIDRWSTDQERESLISTMLQSGQDELLKALQKEPDKGRLWFPEWQGPDPAHARIGFTLRYANTHPAPEGGQRIVVALDRYISFWEAANQPRSFNYPFTLIELNVDRNGTGEGKMSVATKINFDKKNNRIELENYASEPVRLQNVKVTPKRT
jgi:hypothetical protein